MRCVVVGGSGFIGSHVVDALMQAGFDVAVVDKRPPHRRDVQYIEGDIRDLELLTKTFAQFGRNAIFHLAAIANAREALNDPIRAIEVNVLGTTCVLEAAKRAEVERMVLASTVWFFNAVDQTPRTDGQLRFLTEDERILPQGGGHVYTTSKITSEFLCHDYHRLYGLPFTILRYGIPYGTRMWPGLALRSFVENSFEGKPIRIFGDGSAVRRFLNVEDLARAHVLALSDIGKNQVYNLEGDHDVTIRELAETVREFMPTTKIEYIVDPSRLGELSLSGVAVSNEKAKKELAWRPTIKLRDGVERVIEWYRSEHGNPKVNIEAKL